MAILHETCEGCRKLAAELDDARHETLEAAERLHVAEDLVRALGGRLIDRHHELRRLRAGDNQFRGAE